MSYYKKMFRVFSGIAIIYTLLIESVLLGIYETESKAEYNRNAASALTQMADFSDSRLQAAQETSLMLGASEYTNKYLGESSAQHYDRLRLAKYVNGIFGVTPAQKYALAITKLSDDYVIMNNSTGSVDFFQSIFHIGDKQLEQISGYFKENQNDSFYLMAVRNPNGKQMYVLAQRKLMGYPSPLYVFTEFYEDQLFDLAPLAKGGTFALLYKNRLAASAGELSQKELARFFDEEPEESKNLYKEKISFIPGIRYVYFPPKRKVITPVLLLILATGAVVLGAGIFLMMLITRKMYTPIRNVVQTAGGRPVSEEDDEFAYIRETISALHNDVGIMSQSLEKYNASLESKCIRDLLLGLIPQNQIAESLRQFHLTQISGPLVVVILKYQETAELETGFSHTMTADIRQKMAQALTLLFQFRPFFRIIDISFEKQALIVSADNINTLSEQLRNTLLNLEPEYGLEMTAFVGSPCNSLDRIASSWQQANKIADISEYLVLSAKVVTSKDIESSGKRAISYPLNTEQALINGVIHCRASVWQSAIEEIIKTNQNEYNSNIAQLSLMLTSTVNRIIGGLSNQDHQFAEIFGKDTIVYLEFRSCRTYQELHQKSLQIFGTLEKWFEKEQEKSNSGIAERMLDYVRKNYNKDISLLDLADYLNLSRNYVSTLFKSSTGHNFKDYLSQYRFKMACNILKEHPVIRIKKVAEMVGCNTDILSRLFMRYAGMSPSDYQRQMEYNENS